MTKNVTLPVYLAIAKGESGCHQFLNWRLVQPVNKDTSSKSFYLRHTFKAVFTEMSVKGKGLSDTVHTHDFK